MNRAEKRRLLKAAKKSRKTNGVRSIRAGERIPDGAPEGYLNELARKGVELHQMGRLRDAENIFRQILQIDPDHADANHLLGGLVFQAGDPELAIGLIAKAIARAPELPLYHFNLGSVFKTLARLTEAVDSFRNAVALKPDYAEAHFGLAGSLQTLGRLEEATAGYRRVLAAAPDNIAALNNLGVTLQGLGCMDEAFVCLRQAVALSPGYASAHGNLAKALLKIGQAEGSVASNQRALSLNPALVESHNNLGNALQALGRYDDAVASYDRAIALKPDYAEAHGNRGNALQVMGRLEEAVTSCEAAIALKPEMADLQGNLGTAQQKLGRLEDAIVSYSRAINLEPDHEVFWNNLMSAIKAVQYVEGQPVRSPEPYLTGLDDAARASGQFAMFNYAMAAFRPDRAEKSFHEAMAKLPSRDHRAVIVDDGSLGDSVELPEKLIALLHFGRSGTGLLHSLIDGHPEISTLPSIYLRGYFNAGVWETISAGGWRELPDRFADMFEVLFDAASDKITPGVLDEKNSHLGVKEGMTTVGDNRDETLTVDRKAFRDAALGLMRRLDTVDPLSFLRIVHAAYEVAVGGSTGKHTMFYHIHNPEHFTKLNFLHNAPGARMVMMVREPLQCCESWLQVSVAANDYGKASASIYKMLFAIDQIPFRLRDSVGLRLEDLKARPEDTMGAFSAWMGVEDTPSLYEMTAQGKKWWGDPSSPDYSEGTSHSPFDDSSVRRSVGSIFSETDQLVLGTLFYPFSVRFGYREADQAGFERDLQTIRPLLDGLFDFEKAMAERLNLDHDVFKAGGAYRVLRTGLLERWTMLDETGDYPHMLTPLAVAGR
ncbi:MAG: tetratricopeptide repeat protein [Proteobacteria bacterium]|nr:tetratricopeptide repeat protein [Pseudomonadota bacterium]